MGFRPRVPFRTVISRLGLDTGLKLCLDAGDIASAASATPDKWLDVSGGGYDFFRGTGTGADAADPTFNGTPGNLSANEYWTSDAGDLFRYDTTNETWMQNLHKDNAKFTACGWVYWSTGGTATSFALFGTNGGSVANTGVHLVIQIATSLLTFRSVNTSVAACNKTSAVVTATNNAWNFIGVTVDEAAGAGGSFFFVNGAGETFDGTYSSPAAGNASFTMEVANRGNADPGVNFSTACRLAFCAIWEGVALTQAQLTAIYNATQSDMRRQQPPRFFRRKF